ncbi:MAG TPA: GrpB family protein, partial [Bacillales bacterium]|nr:GrpB family protein [Bacillales bacterium]
MRTVKVVPHNKRWAELFLEEREKKRLIFGKETVNIYHIGSTAIPNIHAKPIIDILVEVKDIENIDRLNSDMRQINY